MTYEELDARLQGRCKESRKLANNTRAFRFRVNGASDYFTIHFHRTDILTFYKDGSITVSIGGWYTPTTKERLNRFLPEPYHVHSFKGQWWLFNGGWEPYALFKSGMVIHPDGFVDTESYVEYQVRKKKELAEYRRNHVINNMYRCWETNDKGRFCNLFLRKDLTCTRHGVLALPGED